MPKCLMLSESMISLASHVCIWPTNQIYMCRYAMMYTVICLCPRHLTFNELAHLALCRYNVKIQFIAFCFGDTVSVTTVSLTVLYSYIPTGKNLLCIGFSYFTRADQLQSFNDINTKLSNKFTVTSMDISLCLWWKIMFKI